MAKTPEIEILEDIRHFMQVGFMMQVAILQQIREGKKGEPTARDIREASTLLSRGASILPRDDD